MRENHAEADNLSPPMTSVTASTHSSSIKEFWRTEFQSYLLASLVAEKPIPSLESFPAPGKWVDVTNGEVQPGVSLMSFSDKVFGASQLLFCYLSPCSASKGIIGAS